MHRFGVDATRFPLVVDSDPDKVGTFVPGTGQRIVFRDALKGMSVELVIIPSHWRAKDITAEMAREGIVPGTVVYTSKDGRTSKSFPALEWQVNLCSNIPNQGEEMERY